MHPRLCLVYEVNVTSANTEMCCPPRPGPGPLLRNHQSYCPKAWSHQQRVYRVHATKRIHVILQNDFTLNASVNYSPGVPLRAALPPLLLCYCCPAWNKTEKFCAIQVLSHPIHLTHPIRNKTVYILTVWRGNPSCSSEEEKSAACKHRLDCCWRALREASWSNTIIISYYFTEALDQCK